MTCLIFSLLGRSGIYDIPMTASKLVPELAFTVEGYKTLIDIGNKNYLKKTLWENVYIQSLE